MHCVKKLIREKDISGALLSAVVLFGWHFFFFLEAFFEAGGGKGRKGFVFGLFLFFFNAPYGLFINWKTSNCEVDDDVQLQPVPNQVVGSTCSSECEPLPPT